MTRPTQSGRLAAMLVFAAALAACGGGGSNSGGNGATYMIGGTVSGLAAGTSVVLQDNGGDNLSVTANGAFTFATKVASGAAYAVTVLTQPAGQACTVTAGSGTAAANVSSVAVACVAPVSIGGTVSGLAAGTSVILQDNGGDNLAVGANGSFVFPTLVPSGAAYKVTVLTQPTSQICTVTMGSGTTAAANVSTVAVACSAVQGVTTYTVGGTITGLTAAGLQLTLLANSGTDNSQSAQTLTVAANSTTFTFGTGLIQNPAVTAFSALVSVQPTDETCAVTNGFGDIDTSANITTVQVTCAPNVTTPLQGVYDLSGASGAGSAWLAFYPDGTYIFGLLQPGKCNGINYGVYNFDAATGGLKIISALVYKPLAPCGFTDVNGNVSGTAMPITFTGSGATSAFSLTAANGSTLTGTAAPSTAGSIVGAYTFGTGLDQGVLIFGSDGHYAFLNPQNDPTTGSGAVAGLEYGCYTAANGIVNYDTTATCANAITNAGTSGFSGGTPSKGSFPYTTPDANTLNTVFDGTSGSVTYKYTYAYTRIVPK